LKHKILQNKGVTALSDQVAATINIIIANGATRITDCDQ